MVTLSFDVWHFLMAMFVLLTGLVLTMHCAMQYSRFRMERRLAAAAVGGAAAAGAAGDAAGDALPSPKGAPALLIPSLAHPTGSQSSSFLSDGDAPSSLAFACPRL